MKKFFKKIMEKILYLFVVALVVAIIALAVMRGLFVNENVAVKAAETQGFSDVQVTHRAIFFVAQRGCSKSDTVRFTVKAINPIGKKVTFYVCSGWLFKGATIRHK